MKYVRPVLLLLGVAFVAHLLIRHGGELQRTLAGVGWAFLPLLTISALTYALHTWAWGLVFRTGKPPVSFARLYGIRMAGEAVNKATPLASLGGEPVKAYLLTRQGSALALSTVDAAASVMLAKAIMTLAQATFVLTGVGVAWLAAPAFRPYAPMFAVFPGFVVVALSTAAFLERRKRHLPAEKRGGPAWIRPLRGTWRSCEELLVSRPNAFLASVAIVLAGWTLNAVELMAASWLVGHPLDPARALALECVVASVNMASFIIPGNAGSQEGAFTYSAPLLGLEPGTGLSLAAIRRCRDFVWIGLGMGLLLMWEGRSWHTRTVASQEANGSTSEAVTES